MGIGLLSMSALFFFPAFEFELYRDADVDRTYYYYRVKIFLYVLLRDIEFLIDPNIEIEKKVKYVRSRFLFFTNGYSCA